MYPMTSLLNSINNDSALLFSNIDSFNDSSVAVTLSNIFSYKAQSNK